VVSGGHTKLILMKGFERFKEIGSTRDDAAGEAFDKVAKLLKLGYPGGPVIAAEAAKFQILNFEFQIGLPRPMINSNDFDFSFSGLKTAVLYTIKNKRLKLTKQFVAHLCAEFQQAVIDVLINKTIKAARKYKAKSVILAGGVAANTELRQQLKSKVYSLPFKVDFLTPPKNLCTDNAAMIAAAGYFKCRNLTTKQFNNLTNNWRRIRVNPNL
jgi:N6-L-threonylcarbamoyladenine synthase